ncbi:MAG: sodium:solute symporter family protein [Clostridiales bacterium]
MNNTILIIVLAVYFIAMIGIGLLGKKKYGNNFDNLITAGRNVGIILFMGGAIGTHVGNGFVIGGSANGAASGMSGIWYGIVCALSYLIVAFTVNNRIYAKGFISLPEFLQERYGDRTTSLIFCIGTSVGFVGNIGVQLIAGKALFTALGLNGNMGAIIITLVVLAYSSLSGLWGAYATSAIQVGVIIIGLGCTCLTVIAKGGIGVITAAVSSGALPDTFLNPFADGLSPLVLMLVPITMSLMADQGTVQRVNSAKSASVAFKGFIISAVVMIPLAFMPAFIGMYGAAAYGLSDNSAFFAVAMNMLNPVLAAVLIAAVIAAIMSTIDSLAVAVSTVVLHNVYRGMINPHATDKSLTIADRIVTIAVCAIALTIALLSNDIIRLLVACSTITASAAFAPFVLGMFWKRATTPGAIASSITGLGLSLLSLANILPLPYEEITPIVISVIVCVVVSLATHKRSGNTIQKDANVA